jgi:hypothetical protein
MGFTWKFWLFQLIWGIVWSIGSVVVFTIIVDQIGK